MEGLSEHTLLINKLIGLTKRIRGWPTTLRDLGYNIDLIGASFLNPDGKSVIPDITLTSRRLVHSLLTECKGGVTVDKDQLERYTKINVESIREKVNIHDPSNITFDVCYVTTDKNKDSVLANINGVHSFPLIFFSDTSINKENDFQKSELNNAFSSEIQIENKAPTNFYPFDEDDDPSLIAIYFFREIVTLAIKRSKEVTEIDPEYILSNIHPLWNYFDHSKKMVLRRKVNSILLEYKRKKLKPFIEKVKGRTTWRVTKTLQALSSECQKIIDDIEKQRKLFEYERPEDNT